MSIELSSEFVWMPVALAEDLAAGRVMRAVINADSVMDLAIWRSQSGKVHAWDNRCPHRGMRLSFGFVRGERLSCIYHGWQYGEGGACQHIPAHPDMKPPASICARTFDCKEDDGLIWVSPGSESKSDFPMHGGEAIRSISINASVPDIRSCFSILPFPLDVSDNGDETYQVIENSNSCIIIEGSSSHQTRKLIGWFLAVDSIKTMVHLQTSPTASTELKILLSRWAERLRWSAENLGKSAVA
ncbi:MAG: Rieske (2Fe-2S) protein [Hyphomicrobiales bacterium]